MNRRTPRRRISPRTVRRYRAIKNFVRRALGTSSQPDIKSKSSISVSVLDLKQKINGIEQQLSTVSKHCQDLATLESKLKLRDNLSLEDTETDIQNIIVTKTEVLQKNSQDRCNKRVNNRSTPKCFTRHDEAGVKIAASDKMLDQNYANNYKEDRKSKLNQVLDPIEENEKRFRRRKTHVASRTLPADLATYGSYEFNETKHCTPENVGHAEIRRRRNRNKTEYFELHDDQLNNHAERTCGDHRNHGHKFRSRPNLDQDFISDIIRRQYRPVKLFGRRESDFSQISAPVCRDQEFSIRQTIEEGSDLCSCCHEKHRRHRHTKCMCSHDLSDLRSICDTRLYSSKKHNKHITNHRKHANDYYNDSTMYDVIPVKEKSSPKSRRKFVEENMIHGSYREVPPSPRSQRPRLNLQAQLQRDEDDIYLKKQWKQMKKLQQKSLIQNEGNFSKMSSEVFIHNRNFKCTPNLPFSNDTKPYIEECVGTTSNLQYPDTMHEQPVLNNDITLNTQSTDITAEKTDKTLNEIKDILQSFLLEIKKESSQSEKINNTPQSLTEALTNTNEIQSQTKTNSFNNNNNFGHCGLPPFMQTFPNPCCYPLLPVCPINCMQNGFALPSPSFTCACVNNSKERACESNDTKNKTNNSGEANSETQKLIKEIHNLISQNQNSVQKKEFRKNAEIFANRSTSSKVSKHDAKVGTRILKCQSKSCEALGSREATNTLYATNASYSDTVLEKGSGEEVSTESVSESEYSSDPTVVNKKKGSKFKNILRSMGIFKKNRSDAIEELSETDSSTDVVKQKPRSPLQSPPISSYQQHILNYNMHGQEYFHPPVPHHQHQYECCAHHEPRLCYSPTNIDKKIKHSQGRYYQKQDMLTHCRSPIHSPTAMCANCYDPHYGNVSPQVPVCLKEIEVKSIGTQSVRKISLLEKLTNKMQVPVQQAKDSSPKTSSSGTKDKGWKGKPEPSLFDWKKIHEKAMQKTTDPLKFSYKTQKRLAEGDNTMRNAMLKKLFYKRNPFSPRNLLVRTLLGKDKSSFGEPPKMYKPKMFL